MSLATISIVGNLAREPEQFQFASGRIKTTLFVAVNSFNKIRKEKTTDYYRVETWDRLAELSRDYLHKGNQVAVSGRIALDKWVDREGKDRVTPTVQANQLAFPPRLRPTESDQSETHHEHDHVVGMEPQLDTGPPETDMMVPEEEVTEPVPEVEKSNSAQPEVEKSTSARKKTA